MQGMDKQGLGGSARLAALALSMLVAAIVLTPSAAQAAPSYPEAVLLVSGFETDSPYTTPAKLCDGKEGSEWNPQKPKADPPVGIAYALKQAGHEVFTAPVIKGGGTAPITPPTACAGHGETLPNQSTVIDSNGGTAANGIALANLIAFIRDEYGVSYLHIVGHSDGGLWSRSGITQNSDYAGVTVQSLTTLGTPHTGSYLADLAMGLYEGNCDFSNRIEQRICDVLVPLARLIVTKLGKQATRELTSGFLTTWNPEQRIGRCPVSVIAGDHVDFGIPFLGYYTPSDGLVGLDSAQASEALDINGHLIPAPEIPDLRKAGVYDVVHGASVGFLSKKNLLNQTEISQQVAENTILGGAEACNQPPAITSADTDPGEAGSSSAGQVQRLRAPLLRLVAADRYGHLPKPGPEDFAVTPKGVGVRCGFTKLRAIPVMGDSRLRIHHPRGCETQLRVRNRNGKGVARALMLRSNPRRHVLVRLEGARARIRIRGRAPKSLKAMVLRGKKWQRLKLDRKGRTKLPEADGGSLSLRIRARRGGRSVPADSASLTIQR